MKTGQMTFFEKMDWSTIQEGFQVPKLGMQQVRVPCHHCGSVTVFPVAVTHIDWERVAEKYRHQANELAARFERIIADIDVMGTAPNPIREYMQNEWKITLEDLKREIES